MNVPSFSASWLLQTCLFSICLWVPCSADKNCSDFPALQRRGVSYWNFEYAVYGKGANLNLFAPPNKCGAISWWWSWSVYNPYMDPLLKVASTHVGPNNQAAPVEFVPSQSTADGIELLAEGLANLTKAQGFPPKHLLGFNEPDINSQSNINASYAAYLWRYIENAAKVYPDMKIGSPGTAAYPIWMLDWVAACDDMYCGTNCKAGVNCKSCNSADPPGKRGCKWDFLNVHQYSAGPDITPLQDRIKQYAFLWPGVKMWVTEVGWLTYQQSCASLSGSSQYYQALANTYGLNVLDFLDNHNLVERYAWFSVDVWTFDQNANCYKWGSLVEPDNATFTPWGQNFTLHNLDPSFVSTAAISSLHAWLTSGLLGFLTLILIVA